MSTLFGFGDSFTQGHNLDTTYEVYKKWRELREDKKLPETWFDLLSNKLEYEGRNYAVAGMSNSEIIDTINCHVKEFQKGDIVIINWTYTHRFRWATYLKDKNGNYIFEGSPRKKTAIWKRLGITLFDQDSIYINPKTQLDIAENNSNELYVQEIYNYENILDRLAESVGFKVFYWSADPYIINNLEYQFKKQPKYIYNLRVPHGKNFFWLINFYGGKTISQECEPHLYDMHLGEKGHQVQFELFYKYINETF